MSRHEKLAEEMVFWSLADKTNTEYVDESVYKFASEMTPRVEELKNIETALKELEMRKLKLAQDILSQYYETVDEATLKVASEEQEHPLTDKAFWFRAQELTPKIYHYLEPKLEELERFVVATKIKMKKEEERKKKVTGSFKSKDKKNPDQ